MMRSNTHSGAFLYSAGNQHRKLHQLSVCLSVFRPFIYSITFWFICFILRLLHSPLILSVSLSSSFVRCAFNNTWPKIRRGILIPSKKMMHINSRSQLLLIFIKATPAEIFEDKACVTNIAYYHYHRCSC